MLRQKFIRGNLVNVSSRRYKGTAIILGSYDDLFGGGNIYSYSVMFQDTGCSVSWFDEDEICLLNQGGEHLIIEAKERRMIREAGKIKLRKNMYDVEIKLLFRVLGYLHDPCGMPFGEWETMFPLFQEIRDSENLELLKEKYQEYDVESVWKAFHENGVDE